MFPRKVLCFMLFALIAVVPTASWGANGVQSVQVTGTFFNTVNGQVHLCAQVTPAVAGVTVRFTGTRPDNIVATAGPAVTDIFGRACVRADWWQGVYSVVARAGADQIPSPPVAILVFIPDFCGAVGGGQLQQFCFGVPPNVQRSITGREENFAFAYETFPKNYFGLLFYDNDNPLGAICFMATSFRTVRFQFNGCNQVTFTGYGVLTVGNGTPRFVSYTATAIDCVGGFTTFRLQLRDFAGNLIYDSAPCPMMKNPCGGDVIVSPCPT